MFSVKHIVAALTLGTALLMAPVAATAVTPHHSTAAHPVSHKKKKHKKVHHRHTSKPTALKTKTVKATALKTKGVKPTALKSRTLKPTTLKTASKTKAAPVSTTPHRHHPDAM